MEESNTQLTLDSILSKLNDFPYAVLRPQRVFDPSLTSKIASLGVHPALEACLHLLNADLPSAHFLVRHMQGPPAYEGMMLHSILHRTEGDYDNSRAWLEDVKESEILEAIWGCENDDNTKGRHPHARALDLVAEVEALAKKNHGDPRNLEVRGRKEMEQAIAFCRNKFGDCKLEDATEAWTRPNEKVKKIGQEMTTGNKGWREF